MALSAVQFWQQIESADLATAAESRAWATRMAETQPADQMLEAESVARWLIQNKLLTKYQAQILLGMSEGPLRCGDYVVVSQIQDPSLAHWYVANVGGGDKTEYWLLAIPQTHLETTDFRQNPPSVAWSQAQARITDPSLCALTPAQFSHDYLCVASSAPHGRSLASTMEGIAIPAAAAKSIVIQVAMALDAIHSANLTHGDIGMHSVWWDGDQQVTLLRDPLFLPVNPLAEPHRLTTLVTDNIKRLRFAAPEFSAPGTLPTPATDMYALGALWFELLTGQPFVKDSNPTTIIKSILQTKLRAIDSDGWDSRHNRVLHHLLAKNPNARFGSISQLLQAVQAAGAKPTIATKTPPSKELESQAVPAKLNGADESRKSPQVAPSESKKNAWKPAKPAAEPKSSTQSSPLPPVSPSVEPSAVPAASPPRTTPRRAAENVTAKPQKMESAATPSAAVTEASNTQSPANAPPIQEQKVAQVDRMPPPQNVVAPAASAPDSPKSQLPNEPLQGAALENKRPKQVTEVAESNKPVAAPIGALQTSLATKVELSAPRKPSTRTSTRRKGKPVWLLPTIGVAALALMGVLVMTLQNSKQVEVPRDKLPTPDTLPKSTIAQDVETVAQPEVAPDPVAEQFNLVSNDAEALWAPPHVPDPIALQMLPPGMQGLLHIRVAKILSDATYSEIDAALQPAYESLVAVLAEQLPVKVADFSELTIALYPNDSSEWPDMVIRGELLQPTKIDSLFEKYAFTTPPESAALGPFQAQRNSNASLGVVTVLSKSEPELAQTVIVGPPRRITEMVEMEGGVAPLIRQLEQLRAVSSEADDITYLTTTSLLLSSGRGILANQLATLLPYLRLKMREDIAAVSLTTNMDDAWYGELRFVGKDEQSSPRLQNELRDILKSLPTDAESMLVTYPPEQYWAKVAIRLPQQLRTWSQYLRTGIESGINTANFYLPKKAAANLSLAAWMTLRRDPDVQPLATTTSIPATNQSLSMSEILSTPMTVGFEQESFEISAQTIEQDFNAGVSNPTSQIHIQINGPALEKDGITRNYQVKNFMHKNVPLRDVLIDLVRKGNPVTTVQSPAEKDQKLLWVVRDEASHTIEITTRAAAAAENLTLPEEFQLKE